MGEELFPQSSACAANREDVYHSSSHPIDVLLFPSHTLSCTAT